MGQPMENFLKSIEPPIKKLKGFKSKGGPMETKKPKTSFTAPKFYNNNSHKEKEKYDNLPPYQCHECGKAFMDITFLLIHYSLTHYRAVLSTRFAKALKEKHCSICKKAIESPDQSKMLRHIGVWHRRVVSCLPKDISERLYDLPLKKSTPKLGINHLVPEANESKSSILGESPEQIDSVLERMNTIPKEKANPLCTGKLKRGKKPEDLQKCQLCGIQKRNKSALLQHVCSSHYHRDLKNEFAPLLPKLPSHGSKNLIACPKCDRMLIKHSLFVHLGTVHKEVLKYAPWLKPIVTDDDILDTSDASISGNNLRRDLITPAEASSQGIPNLGDNPNFSSPKATPPTFVSVLSPVYSPQPHLDSNNPQPSKSPEL